MSSYLGGLLPTEHEDEFMELLNEELFKSLYNGVLTCNKYDKYYIMYKP